jgi:hypothetical protein
MEARESKRLAQLSKTCEWKIDPIQSSDDDDLIDIMISTDTEPEESEPEAENSVEPESAQTEQTTLQPTTKKKRSRKK